MIRDLTTKDRKDKRKGRLPFQKQKRRGVISILVIVIIGFTVANVLAGLFLDQFQSSLPNREDHLWLLQHRDPTLPPRNSSVDTAGFVHIGKTGGSTISKLLRNGCTSFVTERPCRTNITDETYVSKFVEHYYHVVDFWRLPQSHHKAFILSVRDVFDRTVSALLYHHPKNAEAYNLVLNTKQKYLGPMAYECFPTLEQFANLLVPFGNSTECHYPYRHNQIVATECAPLACAVVHGRLRFFSHLFFNYQNILYTKLPLSSSSSSSSPQQQQQQPPREIYVLRQEKLWDDWKALNVLLGQREPVKIPSSSHNDEDWNNQRNITGLELPVTREISYEGRQKLCKALETEYMAYFRLLTRAINLHEKELEECRQIAQKNCPNLDTMSMLKHV